MSIERVSPAEAKRLVEDGYAYIDVRSVPEFAAGHPEGAFNVPLLHATPAGMSPNPEFLRVMQARFPKDARLVVGCQAGGRSLQAASVLQGAGFTNVVDQRAGFAGTRDASGRGEPGWKPAGLPVSRDAAPGHSWEELRR